MIRYIAKRLLYLSITLFVIITGTFFLMKKLPGTPFDMERLDRMTPQQRTAAMEKYGLNDSVAVQYGKYMLNLFKGDLGTSFSYRNVEVAAVLKDRFGPSCLVGVQAVLLGVTVGLVLGILAACKHNSMIDYFTMVLAVLGVSIPNFVMGALLQYYVGLKWGILPVAFWTEWKCSVLPSLALCVSPLAMIARFVRTEMLDVLQQDYMITAKAKGLSQFRVLVFHAIRNSIIPAITVLGPIIVNILTGSLAIEAIFSVPGMGSLFTDCVKANDYTVIMGITIFFSAFYMLTVLVTDILYTLIDPRMRLIKKKG